MKTIRTELLGAGIALALAWASPAAADVILFNPGGGGLVGALAIDALDQAPGNGLGVGVTTASSVGTSFTFLYQSNLANADLSGVHVVPGDGTGTAAGHFFTFAAGFGETLTGFVPNFPGPGNATLGFALDLSNPTNFFNMYVSKAGPGSNLAGTGFVKPHLILSGQAITTNFLDTFTFHSLNPASAVALDQAGANNYPATKTLVGDGIANIQVSVLFADAAYFPTLLSGGNVVLGMTNTTEHLPYNTADPSACFSSDGVTSCNQPGVASVGAINASSGPNTLLQADASTSFQVTAVPEPGTLALMGGGLAMAIATLRRRQRGSSNL